MKIKVLVAIAPGSEEIETVAIVDILRRADIDVTLASCSDSKEVKASRGVRLIADKLLNELELSDFHMLVLPGGLSGAEYLRDTPQLIAALKYQQTEQKWLAAICAAPAVILQHHQLVENACLTCHPAFQHQLNPENLSTERVVTDLANKLITSQGPGSAIEFALTLVEHLAGKEKAAHIAAPLIL